MEAAFLSRWSGTQVSGCDKGIQVQAENCVDFEPITRHTHSLQCHGVGVCSDKINQLSQARVQALA